mgnify:CR=1 FL=1
MMILELKGVHRSYVKDRPVLNGIDLNVTQGEVIGLLGQNGAGKTTLLECLLGLRPADAGEVTLAGLDLRMQPRAALRVVGAQLQPSALQDKITPREALRFHAALHGVAADVAALLARFGLAEKADARFEALALVHRPALLVLDEPTTGLDPQTRRALHQILRDHRTAGGGVLLSTHDLDEAERLCDRVAILHRGRIVADAAPAALLIRASAGTRLRCRTAQPQSFPDFQSSADGLAHAAVAPEAARAIAALTRAVQEAGNTLVELQLTPPTLEDAFVALTGDAWDDKPEAAP